MRVPIKSVSVLIRKMSSRYFKNVMINYKPTDGTLTVDFPKFKSRIQNIVSEIENNFKPTDENARDGLYLGTAGIAYMFYHLQNNPLFDDCVLRYQEKTKIYLESALRIVNISPRNKNEIPSFILGNCGVYAFAAVFYTLTKDFQHAKYFSNLYQDVASICMDPNFLACGSDELFVGRAGYILGALWISKVLNQTLPSHIYELCRITIESGRKYAIQTKSASPLMYSYYDVEYLGAAHGLASILQTIISVPGYLDQNPNDAKDIKASVDYLLSLQDQEGNFPCTTHEIGQPNELIHWCHGAGGIIFLMAKAYVHWNENKYLESCERMGELVWRKGLLRKGPGICHGIAGNGYVFLLMYQTGDPNYLHRAIQFAEFMEHEEFKRHARVPDSPFSLYEGLAGTVCFLSDLTNPEKGYFPFFTL